MTNVHETIHINSYDWKLIGQLSFNFYGSHISRKFNIQWFAVICECSSDLTQDLFTNSSRTCPPVSQWDTPRILVQSLAPEALATRMSRGCTSQQILPDGNRFGTFLWLFCCRLLASSRAPCGPRKPDSRFYWPLSWPLKWWTPGRLGPDAYSELLDA